MSEQNETKIRSRSPNDDTIDDPDTNQLETSLGDGKEDVHKVPPSPVKIDRISSESSMKKNGEECDASATINTDSSEIHKESPMSSSSPLETITSDAAMGNSTTTDDSPPHAVEISERLSNTITSVTSMVNPELETKTNDKHDDFKIDAVTSKLQVTSIADIVSEDEKKSTNVSTSQQEKTNLEKESTTIHEPNSSSAPNMPIQTPVQTQTTPSSKTQKSNTSTTTIQKVKIHFIPVGSAPQMNRRKFNISGKEQFGKLQEKLRKMLKLDSGSTSTSTSTSSSQLFLYINESFVPSPDDVVGELSHLFSSRGELKVNYSLQEAWG